MKESYKNDYYVESEKVICENDGIEFFTTHLCNKLDTVNPHIHSSVEILFIRNGSFRVYADNDEYILNVGDIILFRSNTIHKVYVDVDTEGDYYYYCLKISPSTLLGFSSGSMGGSYLMRLSLSSTGEKTVWRRDECDSLGITRFLERIISESENGGYGSDISVKLCACEIILTLLRDIERSTVKDVSESPCDDGLVRRIYNALVYINKNYQRDITASECGRIQYMSYSYFSRTFKKVTGMSFRDYLNLTRINHAEKALLSTDKTITEIALECGFNNASYFITIYKKIKGVTPSVFRERKE